MRKIIIPGLAVMIFFGLAISGCMTYQREQIVENNWGKAFHAIKTNHIINPDAGLDEKTVEGMAGVTSEKAVKKYQESFDEKPPAQVTNINISGIGK